MDEDGFLYFIGRKDEMIKTSGYRVSPTEVEEVAYASGLVGDAVAVGVPHPDLGQAIVLVVSHSLARLSGRGPGLRASARLTCKSNLPNFMVPHRIEWLDRTAAQPQRQVRPPGARGTVQDHCSGRVRHDARRILAARAAPLLRRRRTANC